MEILDEARESGLAVSCDVYPYTAGSTQLIQILPPEYLEGGVPGILKRLTDPKMRKKLTDILQKPGVDFENLVNLIGWENIRMTTLNRENNREYSGKSVAEIARLKGMDLSLIHIFQHQALGLAVLCDQRDLVGDGFLRRVDGDRLSVQNNFPAGQFVRSEDGADDLGASGTCLLYTSRCV